MVREQGTKIAKLEEEVKRIAQGSRDLIDEFTRWGRSVEEDFQSLDRRLNRHRVDLDSSREKVRHLVGAIALRRD